MPKNSKELISNTSSTQRRGSTAILGKTTLPIPSDPSRPSMIPSLPQSVERQLGALNCSIERVGEKNTTVWRIPAALLPTNAQRVELRENAQVLFSYLGKTPMNDAASIKATSMVLFNMLKVLPGSKIDDTSADAVVETYLDALEDLPSWAVSEAMRRWNRGDCGQKDYHFRPAPAELRAIAKEELWKVEGRARHLLCLAKAEAEPEWTVEHREGMLERLRRLFQAIVGREDPIDRMRRDHREEVERQHRVDQARAIKEIGEGLGL